MSKWRLTAVAFVALAYAVPAMAQDPRVEVSGTVGWTFSDGVSTDTPILSLNGNVYDRVDPKDSFSWGLGLGVLASPNVEVGFLFGQQMSKLVAGGPAIDTDVGDMTINSYHGYFGYNFFDIDATARPYLFFGLGASSYGAVSFTDSFGASREIGGLTKFSTTWGAGVKVHQTRGVGFRGGIQWTPAYIKTDSEGWWCDPWWGCYVVGNAQYSNQWQFNGGVLFRF